MPETLSAEPATSSELAAVELLGPSVAIARVKEIVRRAAVLQEGILLTGEPGVDLDAVAAHLHARSRNAAGAYITVDCEATEPARVDHALFGSMDADAPADLESVSADSRIAAARG